MKRMYYAFGIGCLAILLSCTTGKSGGEGEGTTFNPEALRSEALDILKGLGPVLDQLTQQKNSINVQSRALTEEEMEFVSQVEAVEKQVADAKTSLNELGSELEKSKESDWQSLIAGLKATAEAAKELASGN